MQMDRETQSKLDDLFIELNYDTRLRLGTPKTENMDTSKLWILLLVLGLILLLLIVTVLLIVMCMRKKKKITDDASAGLYHDMSYSGLDLNNQETLTYLSPHTRK